MKTKALFFIKNALLNIVRNRHRYIIIWLIILLAGLLSYSALTVVVSCGRFADAERIRVENMSNEEKAAVGDYYSDISRAEGVRQVGSIIVLCCVVFGIPVFLLSVMLMQDSRTYELGIYYSLGFGRSYIVMSMLTEYVVSALPVLLLSRILSRLAVYLMIKERIIPDIRGYMNGSGFGSAVFLIPLLVVLIPAAILNNKIRKARPVETVKGR